MIEYVMKADKRTDGKMPTVLKTYFSAFRALSYISRHVIFTATLWNTKYLYSQVRSKHWLSGLPHITESCFKVISVQTQTEIFASSSHFCSVSLPLRTSVGLNAFPSIFPTLSFSLPSNLLESLHRPNWCPLPTAVKDSNSHILPIQPFCI